MNDKYQKYLMVFEQDEKWGFYINNLGRTVIEKKSDYPSLGHPGSHMFSWEKGRILDEFHFVLITDGEGTFESEETGMKKISDGDGFLLFPGVWHRYKPNKKTGWNERWVGFSGDIARQFLSNGYFKSEEPLIIGCNRSTILNYFDSLFQLFENEPFGFQRLASGICIQLMAELYNIQQTNSSDDDLSMMISRTKHHMYTKINGTINLKELATELGISYSKFRSDFKKQTGISPMQYHIALKIEKSKQLLLRTKMSQKEIAYTLGFESDFYFNRLFKKKTGVTPKIYRQQID